MYISHVVVAALGISTTAQAFNLAEEAQSTAQHSKRLIGSILNSIFNSKAASTCPPVWSEISTVLTAQFLANGQCTDMARSAIRSAFHDCFNGACDGSLILANECSNIENRGMEGLCSTLGSLAKQKNVGTADLIQFAAAHAIKTCPGGPTVPVKVGRQDSSVASPMGILPHGRLNSGNVIQLFVSRGFSTTDVAALIGAHTTARQRHTDPAQANATLDSTPGYWDNKYYQETQIGRAPFTLPSDKSIATNPLTVTQFTLYALSKSAWDSAFVSAMTKLSMLGVNGNGLVDCTSALPGGSRKRDIKSSNVFERLRQ